MAKIKWKTSLADQVLIIKIRDRYFDLLKKEDIYVARVSVEMDITACHLNGCPLRLKDLLEADDFNFVHDVAGIMGRMDRKTGKLTRCFLPRFAKCQ